MKNCSKCKTDKPASEFHKNSRRSDGLQSYCKDCAKIRNADYYKATPERNSQRQATNTRRRRENTAKVIEYLATHPCVDCGNVDIRVLEFDHVRGEKAGNIATMVGSCLSWETIFSEIAKCEVRCANCHRIVTVERAGSARQLAWSQQQTE